MRGGWHYAIGSLGFNYRITDIQSALGISQLRAARALHHRAQRRSRTVTTSSWPTYRISRCRRGHPRVTATPTTCSWCASPRGRGGAASVYDALRAAGIGTQLHYIPIPAHALYRGPRLRHEPGFPQAQAYWEQALSLPMFPTMETGDVERVVTALRAAMQLTVTYPPLG